MKGGVILFRGSGGAARRYVEADRSRADEYYLGADDAIAEYTVIDNTGEVTASRSLSADEYEGWVDWTNPVTGEQMGTPRAPGSGSKGSPLFAEMTINAPKSLSVAAALHPDVSDALDAAQRDALDEIRRWLGQHSVTRAGPRAVREVVPIEHMQVVGIGHKTSRAGDPHRHIHMQIGTRVWAAGKWRALDTAALFKQQGAIRALGTAVIAANPQLADVLDRHGLTLDPVSGEVAELAPFNQAVSKRSAQVGRNLARLESEWQQAHPGQTLGPVMSARLQGIAWAYQRPGKKPADLKNEAWWVQELTDAGYDPTRLGSLPVRPAVSLDDLRVQEVASRALDRCAANASAWTAHTVQEHVTRITTEHGVRATPDELRDFITITTRLAVEDCFSILPPGAPTPDHVAHLTSLRVIAAESNLCDLLTARVPKHEPRRPDVTDLAAAHGLDDEQTTAAAAVASADPLVIVEGAAGSGKTTTLSTAIEAAEREGRQVQVVAPTKKAAEVAHAELGVPADSVAALVYAYGWRWNADGVWTRLVRGDTDPDTGHRYEGPPDDARLTRGDRVVVDEAGMIDQDTAIALFTVANEAGATVALVGDRAQLPAVGRGGVLDMAALIRGRAFDMTGVHRFTDPDYADLTVRMRAGENPAVVFDQLHALGLIHLHPDDEAVREHIAAQRDEDAAVTVATNDDARALNERIRAQRIEHGEVDDARTVTGSDGLSIGAGDVIQTRKNDRDLCVANRQTWTVQAIGDDGTVWAKEAGSGRKRQRTVALPGEYVAEHAHLSYAATAYGVQGATTTGSHTILTDALDAAAVYVGMTRGRETNQLHVVASDLADARQKFIEAMARDRADRGLTAATSAAKDATRGLVEDGPVKLVNTELARLTNEAEQAQQRAERWAQIARQLDAQTAEHQDEADNADTVLRAVEEHAATVRAQAAAPLTVQAEADGGDYLAAVADEAEATERLHSAGRFGRRRAEHDHHTAHEHTEALRARLRTDWGTLPASDDALTNWAAQAANSQAEHTPQVTEATQAVTDAQAARQLVTERQQRDRRALLAKLYGRDNVRRNPVRYQVTNPSREAARWQTTADKARAEAERLRTLPPAEAARQITAKQAAAEAARQTAAERAQRLRTTPQEPASTRDRGRDGPDLGI
ncbi:MobF family relaxase [Bifidobacterium mongoliense]|uniref:MobF family relaxase n=1 Tax=Bifidobacterium mongoliense TaxID=518643 RepID=UPI002647674B|nr:MobF family relaxase [Bifidobacterium mongoliense]MDN6024976.1 AAA family ATPase [Bifidobacterium mongoliense]MDN6719944.1 AAA family ATPase [Bifidobacterium mongoliense]